MAHFMESLISKEKNKELPEEYNYCQDLIGSWTLDYIDHNVSLSIKGEWHFSWILEGMAVQDTIILPSRDTRTDVLHPLTEYGTTLRIYNPNTHAWDIAYGYVGNIMRLEAKKENDMIVLTNIEDNKRKWVFVEIKEDTFHWQNVTVQDDGAWYINADIYAKRI